MLVRNKMPKFANDWKSPAMQDRRSKHKKRISALLGALPNVTT